jgi:hypothetical protein
MAGLSKAMERDVSDLGGRVEAIPVSGVWKERGVEAMEDVPSLSSLSPLALPRLSVRLPRCHLSPNPCLCPLSLSRVP